jgi:hypothetical protein
VDSVGRGRQHGGCGPVRLGEDAVLAVPKDVPRVGRRVDVAVRHGRDPGVLDEDEAVEGVGDYVEIETDVGTEAEVEAAREDAYEVLESLGLDPAEQIRTSYLGLRLGGEDPGGRNAS